MGLAIRYSDDGAIHQICMDWRHVAEVLAAAGDLYEYKNLCVWNKTNAGMGTFYRSKHELVFVFKVDRRSSGACRDWTDVRRAGRRGAPRGRCRVRGRGS
jgi:hypothetical protein